DLADDVVQCAVSILDRRDGILGLSDGREACVSDVETRGAQVAQRERDRAVDAGAVANAEDRFVLGTRDDRGAVELVAGHGASVCSDPARPGERDAELVEVEPLNRAVGGSRLDVQRLTGEIHTANAAGQRDFTRYGRRIDRVGCSCPRTRNADVTGVERAGGAPG